MFRANNTVGVFYFVVGDLVSVHSDAQEPQPSTRAFNSRASLMSRKVPSQKLKPIEWNKQG